MGAFEGLVAEVSQKISIEAISKEISEVLENSVIQGRYSHQDPMIRNEYPHFGLMDELGLVDRNRGVRTFFDEEPPRSPIGELTSRYNFWFLSQKAIKLHKDLCFERYYDVKK